MRFDSTQKTNFLGPKTGDQTLNHCSFNWTLWVASSLSSVTLCQFFFNFCAIVTSHFLFLKNSSILIFILKIIQFRGKNGKAQRKAFKFSNTSLLTLWYYYQSSLFKFYLNSHLYIVRYTYRKTLHKTCVPLPDLVQLSSSTTAVITIPTLFSSLPFSKLLPTFIKGWYCKSFPIKWVYNKHSYSFYILAP